MNRVTNGRQPEAAAPDFLQGGGEMGARMRGFDWSSTPLGRTEAWPQSLRSPLSMMLPSKAQIILFWGPQYVVLYNDAYRTVFGAKHPQVLGQPGCDAWSEIWDSTLHGLLEGVVKTGEAFWAKDMLFFLERFGFAEETYFDVSYDPVRDESGQVGGVYCIVTETTARVLWERRLGLLKDLAARNATARTPREACVLAMEVLAAKPEDTPFALAYLDEELQACTPGAQEAFAATKPEHTSVVSIARTGEGRVGKLVVGLNGKRPFDAEYQSFLDLVAVQVSTAVANAQAYEDERKRAESLAELDRAKTTFFSNVSHEFRTPLTLMLGPLEDALALVHGPLPDAAASHLGIAHRNGQRLLKLVNTLLEFSRIEAGRVQAQYQATELAGYTAELASAFRSACERAGLRLTVDCPPLTQPVHVDRDMWEKVVLNLLSNAFKFTLEGGITVAVRQAGTSVELTVSDTGTGIPAHEIARLFERFHRIENARGRTHEGSGIGLALVQELVKLHGGCTRADSIAGQGTTFTVSIPLGSRHLPADRIMQGDAQSMPAIRSNAYIQEALGWLPAGARSENAVLPAYSEALDSSGPGAAHAPAAGRSHVLVVDDNHDMREYLVRMLAERYEVEAAADGKAGLAAVRQRAPALVLTDVMLPHLDGFGLLRALRADPATSGIPVIMLSARAGQESRVEGMEAGADDYIVKPFSARELLARVAAHLQMARMRHEANATLQKSEERLRAFVNASSDVIYRMSPDWSEMRFLEGREFIVDTNEPSRSWLEKYIHPEDRQRVLNAIAEAIRAKAVFELEHRVLRVDGSLGWTFSRAIPMLDAQGEIVEWFGAAGDVTARKQAEQSLRDADRRKDEFLATLSHELRNPLAPLRNGLQVMRLKGEDASVLGPVREIMERQLNHLVRLVDDLLEMSRITRGTFELRSERVELSTIVRNAVETSEPAIHAGAHRLDISLPAEALALQGDPVRLAQILSNLLNNAAKYTDHGGTILLSVRREGEAALISVRDNGQGITADGLTRIFEMFTREARGRSGDQGGLGIGLTLSRRLAELHGGSIQAHSDGLGKGSEFVVRLPLARSPGKENASANAPGLELPMRVLVVDDNRDAAESLGMLLGALGATVQLAFDGPSAIEAFASSNPSVMLLDIGMPGMNGYEVAHTLRTRYPDRRVPIVALTGWGQEEDRRRALAAGIDHHLVKPAEFEALSDLLSRLSARTAAA